ncbi:hypothetical protein ACJ73_09559 [Blastomyces percursus]|uniref:Chromo domain-containing protein n=1 Tax=Blastomyces percursus TaxID=1658174 RepID=A0A1J9PU02_9EURO|nr:hypothetical protein ACJ73_09559 [Blastomyces percursus]
MMDWEPTGPLTESPTVNRSYRRAKWVTKQELEKRRTEGRCLRCGGSEHRIKDCPYQAAQRPLAGRVTHVVAPLLESDEETERSEVSEQGKRVALAQRRIDRLANANALPDSGCNTFALIDSSFARKHHLQRLSITARDIFAYGDDSPSERVDTVVRFYLDVGGISSDVWAYEVQSLKDYDVILGTPWLKENNVVILPKKPSLLFKNHAIEIPSILPSINICQISASAFRLWVEKYRKPRFKPKSHSDPRGERIIQKLSNAVELAQASMATSQESYELYANSRRQPAPEYKIGDKVWLDLRNIRTDRPSEKLDRRCSKFPVIEKIGSHAYRLNTPPGIHPVFHTWLLRPAKNNRLPSQTQTDWQPPAIIAENGDEEYEVEEIVDERTNRRGQTEYRVRWRGWHDLTWEPAAHLEETIALDVWQRACMNTD